MPSPIIINIGDRCGKLKVLDFVTLYKYKRNRKFVLCVCDCGNQIYLSPYQFKTQHKKSCGCFIDRRTRKQLNPEDYIGKKFNSIKITKYIGTAKRSYKQFEYICDCGNTGVIRASKIGKIKTCGCYYKKGYQKITGTFFARIKFSAEKRGFDFCITKEFLWDLYIKQNGKCALTGLDIVFSSGVAKYDGSASVDRIDSTKGYTPENVQWVHKKINMLKKNFSETELIELCLHIADHNRKSKQTEKID